MTDATNDTTGTGWTPGPAPRRSPLHERHVALGAKFAPFGGWEMPLEYAGGGVIAEHTAVRQAVGVFDVSHLGKIRLTGPRAAAYLNRCLTADLDRIGPGQAQYTLCCDDATGGAVDDLIVYRYADDHVFLVPNAANAAEVARRLSASAPLGITVTDEHERHAVIAVQGPASTSVLAALGLPIDLPYMSFADHDDLVVCRTGYTGELGYELVVPAERAGEVWDQVLAAGAEYGARPCGLGARDTLRTEMGYPLHGQDLSLEITPVQARLGWAVGWSKPEFWGRKPLLAERSAGPRRLLWGLVADGRGIPRPGMRVLLGDRTVGTVTSGTFSPTRRVGIGLALLEPDVAAETTVEVDVRGRRTPMRVVKPPFVASRPT